MRKNWIGFVQLLAHKMTFCALQNFRFSLFSKKLYDCGLFFEDLSKFFFSGGCGGTSTYFFRAY